MGTFLAAARAPVRPVLLKGGYCWAQLDAAWGLGKRANTDFIQMERGVFAEKPAEHEG